jgi:glycosyltransferase involved in cell wall biosynthesis
MTRVLHLQPIDRNTDFQSRRLATSFNEFPRQTIGPGGTHRDIFSAARRLRRDRPADLIHAWGLRPLLAAALANIAPIICTLPPECPKSDLKWLRRVSNRRRLTAVFSSDTARRRALAMEIPSHKCLVIEPGMSMIQPSRDDSLRKQLGLTPADFVIFAPGESTPAARHNLASWAVAILHELDLKWKLLLWGRGKLAADLENFAWRLGRPQLLRFAPQWPYEKLLSVADAALVTATSDAATLPIGLCMMAGLPIVTTSQLFTDRRNALVVADGSPRGLAQRLMELQSDRQLSRQLGNSAKGDAADWFDPYRFLRLHSDLYAQATADKSPNS